MKQILQIKKSLEKQNREEISLAQNKNLVLNEIKSLLQIVLTVLSKLFCLNFRLLEEIWYNKI